MNVHIIGEPPLAVDGQGKLKSRIGTVFPDEGVIVTLPGIHATQKIAFLDHLKKQRAENNLPPLTDDETIAFFENSVDLIMENGIIYIRPNTDRMDLAFKADELLQEIVSKAYIKYLFLLNPAVRMALKKRGESWRITPLPQTKEDMVEMINQSQISIGGQPIYHYIKSTGSRLLTLSDFKKLGTMSDSELARHLKEIADFSTQRNTLGHMEVIFFLSNGNFGATDFAGFKIDDASPEQLRQWYDGLVERFASAIPLDLQESNPADYEWRNRMFAALIGLQDQVISEEVLLGLGSEFFMQIEWVPGARMENGELIFDSIFDEADQHPADAALCVHCDHRAKEFIFNFIREYGDVEYVNVGRVIASLSRRSKTSGSRAVYIAELKLENEPDPIVRIIRMQKWGISEHLDEGKDLLQSIMEAEDYTEYILDRRLACRQLGMNLTARIATRKVNEQYFGSNHAYRGQFIWAAYFERDYIAGIASDKISPSRYSNSRYAMRLAELLGAAAAPSMIVGRMDLNKKVLFDDGDEVVRENHECMPEELIVADHTGAFTHYLYPLAEIAPEYARAVLKRQEFLPDVGTFTEVYLLSFKKRFIAIQQEYRRRRRAFDTLFKHHRRNVEGSFAFRWEKILERLDISDADELVDLIRKRLQSL